MNTNNVIIFLVIIGIAILCYYFWTKNNVNETMTNVDQTCELNESAVKLRNLWFQEAMYMREYIMRAVYQLPSQQEVSMRLIDRNKEIFDAVNDMYPSHTNNKLLFLFRKHIELFLDVVRAIITHDGENYDKSSYAWKNNGVFLANELAKLNTLYSCDALKNLIADYQNATDSETRCTLQQKPAFEEYDMMIKAGNELADYLALTKN